MTDHCEIFIPNEKSLSMEDAVKEVQQSFQKTFQLLQKWADENNVTLEDLAVESEANKLRREKNLANARTNDTSKLANEYRMKLMEFKSKNKSRFEAAKKTFAERAKLELPNDRKIITEIIDAYDTIAWYELQLPVKITRAYMSQAQFADTDLDPIQNDSNGSAKVVLIGVENSFPAWETMMKHFPELESECFAFLVILDKIRKRILADFPLVTHFVRPGFDQQLA
ncbi:MAG: hypothetical protein IPO32_06655 [Crocinitomicaceae bacterium]|nr:hypothetical protein [Crocinitomicaceae bacterium]